MFKKNLIPLAFFIVLFLITSCSENAKTLADMKDYEGPAVILKNVSTLYSDSGLVKVRISAPLQVELKNGNQEFPKGLKVEFYEKDGTISSVLTSNSAVFYKLTNIFTANGNVIVKNIQKNEQLNTEQLNWNKAEKKVYTEKFVAIKTEDELLEGTGLTAAQDFSTYKIANPTGVFSLDEDTLSEE